MAERTVEYKIRAVDEASSVFAKVAKNTQTLTSIGKFTGGLLAVEKINAVMRSSAAGLKQFAEGEITAGEALRKALDPIPIVGAIDDIVEAGAALIKMFDGTADAAKRAAEQAAQIKFNEDFKAMLKARQAEIFAKPAEAIANAGIPSELLTLRAQVRRAQEEFNNQFGAQPDKIDLFNRNPQGRVSPTLLRTLNIAERWQQASKALEQYMILRKRLGDLEAEFDQKQALAAAKANRGGDFGITGALRGAFDKARDTVSDFLLDFGDLAVKRMGEALGRQDKSDREQAERVRKLAQLPNAPAQFAAIDESRGSGLAARLRSEAELTMPKNDELLAETKKQSEQGERLNDNTKNMAEFLRQILFQMRTPGVSLPVFSGR